MKYSEGIHDQGLRDFDPDDSAGVVAVLGCERSTSPISSKVSSGASPDLFMIYDL
jgi:hypothetical protein